MAAESCGPAFLEEVIDAILRGLGCRVAGLARLQPGGERAETVVLRGSAGNRPTRALRNRSYRPAAGPCGRLHRPRAGQHYCYVEDCRAEGLAIPPFAGKLGPASYRGELIVDAEGRPIGQVFALGEAGRPDRARDRAFFRMLSQRAGAEYRRLLAEASRQETQTRFDNLVEGAAEGVLIHHDLEPLFANPALARILGFQDAGEILGRASVAGLFVAEDRPRLGAGAARRGEVAEVRGYRRDGEPIWLSAAVRVVDWCGESAIQCSLTDVTRRRRAEEDKAQLAAIVDSANNAIIGRRLDGTIFSWNTAAERMFGYSAEEAVGQSIEILCCRDHIAEARALVDEVLRGETIVDREFVRRHKDGRWIPIIGSISPVYDAEGKIIGLSSISRDLSRRKQIERELRRSESLLRHAQRLGGIGWWTWQAEDGRILLSPEACDVLGLAPGERLAASLDAYLDRFVHDADRAQVAAALRGLSAERPIAHCRHRVVSSHGGTPIVHLWCEAQHNRDGELLSIMGVVQDVTELERTRGALEVSEARFRDITEVASDWLWETGADGRFCYLSDRVLTLTGYPPSHYLGLTWEDCVADWQSGEPNSLIAALDDKEAFRDVRLRIATSHGREAWVGVSGRPIFDPEHGFLGFRGAASDRTGRVCAESALRQAKELAETANEMKSRFLAAASHDLRQPLHALRLLVSVLATTKDSEKREAVTEEIATGLSSMTSILNALLDVSELDAGGIKPEIADFRLDELLGRAAAIATARAVEKGLDFTCVASSARVRSDPMLLARIVDNFLGNALRYTEQGRVLLGCRRLPDALRIEVWDTGPGIANDRLDEIFEEFHRLEQRGEDRERGLGLGLAIVQRLADLLGHRVLVRSTPGRGSMFAVELPRVELADEAPLEPPVESMPGLDLRDHLVLLIENDQPVRDATRRLLEAWDARVVAASDAQQALQSMAGWQRPPDMIVVDLSLPGGIDGLGAIEAVNRRFGLSLPAMILTGERSSPRLREVRRRGLPVLRKPASPESIRRAIVDLLKSRLAAE